MKISKTLVVGLAAALSITACGGGGSGGDSGDDDDDDVGGGEQVAPAQREEAWVARTRADEGDPSRGGRDRGCLSRRL